MRLTLSHSLSRWVSVWWWSLVVAVGNSFSDWKFNGWIAHESNCTMIYKIMFSLAFHRIFRVCVCARDSMRNILIYFWIKSYDDILSIFYSFDLIRFELMLPPPPPPLPIILSWNFFSSLLLIKMESMGCCKWHVEYVEFAQFQYILNWKEKKHAV